MPLLTIGFSLPIELAIGTSSVAVIATSNGAAAAYVREQLTNLRIGLFRDVATTGVAIAGSLLTVVVAPAALFLVFGVVLP